MGYIFVYIILKKKHMYIYIGVLMGYIYIYIYIYSSQKVAICSLWTVCPCLYERSSSKNLFFLHKESYLKCRLHISKAYMCYIADFLSIFSIFQSFCCLFVCLILRTFSLFYCLVICLLRSYVQFFLVMDTIIFDNIFL